MAAIDPTEEPMYDEDDTERKAPRATLKIVRIPGDMFGDDEDDSEDDDEMDLLNGLGEDSDEDSEEEEVNGGPSETKKAKAIKAGLKNLVDGDDEDMEDISEDDAKAITALKKIMKGKGKAMANDSDKDSDDLDDDEDPLELEEVVICTLDPEKVSSLVAELLIGD
jgi:FK506-binding nuclear protein